MTLSHSTFADAVTALKMTRFSILIVDDQPDVVRELVTFFREHFDAARVLQSTSPLQGLAILREEQPDLLFTDWDMPELSGIELLRRIKIAGQGVRTKLLTNDGEIVISDSGEQGLNNGSGIINNGTISVAGSGEEDISLPEFGEFVNNGTVRATTTDFTTGTSFGFTNADGGALFLDGRAKGTFVFEEGSTFHPGASPGCATFAGTPQSAGTVVIEIDGTVDCTEFDRIVLEADMDKSSATLSLAGSYTTGLGEQFTIVEKQSAGPQGSAFANLPQGSTISLNNVTFVADYLGGDGNDLVLTATAVLPLDLLTFTGRTTEKITSSPGPPPTRKPSATSKSSARPTDKDLGAS